MFRFIYFIRKVLISHEKRYFIILVTGTYFAKLIFHIEDKWDDSLRLSSINLPIELNYFNIYFGKYDLNIIFTLTQYIYLLALN